MPLDSDEIVRIYQAVVLGEPLSDADVAETGEAIKLYDDIKSEYQEMVDAGQVAEVPWEFPDDLVDEESQQHVEKFDPNHDKRGRFASGHGNAGGGAAALEADIKHGLSIGAIAPGDAKWLRGEAKKEGYEAVAHHHQTLKDDIRVKEAEGQKLPEFKSHPADEALGRHGKEGITNEEENTLHLYKGDYYATVNRYLRQGKQGLVYSHFYHNGEVDTAKADQFVHNLDSAISKRTIEAPIELYRGMGFDRDSEKGQFQTWRELKPGEVVSHPAFMSTSYQTEGAHRFGGNWSSDTVNLTLRVPAGVHGIPLDQFASGGKNSANTEKEVLLERGLSLKILKSVPTRIGVDIVAEVIPHHVAKAEKTKEVWPPDDDRDRVEKFDPYHDPHSGKFSSGGGLGAGHAGKTSGSGATGHDGHIPVGSKVQYVPKGGAKGGQNLTGVYLGKHPVTGKARVHFEGSSHPVAVIHERVRLHPDSAPEHVHDHPQAEPPDVSKMTPEYVHLEGAHQKQVYRDTEGQRWLFKPDHTSALAEKIGYDVMHELGLAAPEMHVMSVGGKVGSMQKMWTDVQSPVRIGHLQELTGEQRAQIQQHHVVDWLISQHDTNNGAMLLSKTGQVYAIDKGQAYKFMGKDKLDWSYEPNPERLVYNNLARDHIAGKYTLDRGPIEGMVTKVEGMPESRFRELLTPLAQHREKLGFGSAESFLNSAVARKNSIRSDFQTYYNRMDASRAAAGYGTPKAA